jgi:hypothetical protein
VESDINHSVDPNRAGSSKNGGGNQQFWRIGSTNTGKGLMMRRINWRRLLITSVVAYIVAVATLTLLLGNPFISELLFSEEAGQSEKVLSVWLEQDPLPAVTPFWGDLGEIDGRGMAVQAMLLVWALGVVLVYASGWANKPRGILWRGLTFGVAVWAVLFLFYEAFIPFNLLGEPFPLVLVELALTLVAMLITGVVIALLYRPTADGASAT